MQPESTDQSLISNRHEKSSNLLFWGGIAATEAWILIGAALLIFGTDWSQPLKPNDLGDVLAGLCAPIAFLWLVLGFIQQGQELRMQVAELQHSVEQQRHLVDTTVQEHARLRQIDENATKARFVFVPRDHGNVVNGDLVYAFDLKNEGAVAERVIVVIPVPAVDEGERSFGTVSTQQSHKFTIRLRRDDSPMRSMVVVVRYLDTKLRPTVDRYLGVNSSTGFSFSPVSRGAPES